MDVRTALKEATNKLEEDMVSLLQKYYDDTGLHVTHIHVRYSVSKDILRNRPSETVAIAVDYSVK